MDERGERTVDRAHPRQRTLHRGDVPPLPSRPQLPPGLVRPPSPHTGADRKRQLTRLGSYPKYAASVLAGNDLFRSSVGAGFPLFSTAFFKNLGVGRACSVLGGISVAMIPIPFVLHQYGERIRKWSQYAQA